MSGLAALARMLASFVVEVEVGVEAVGVEESVDALESGSGM